MSKLNKTSSGLLFFDDFSEQTLMWTLSPSDATHAVSFGDNGLQLLHNSKYIMYTIVEPEIDEYSCIVKLDHKPYNLEDIAGVIVMSNTKEYAECQSFMATSPSELNNIDQTENIKQMIIDLLNEANYVQWSQNDEDFPEFSIDDGTSDGSDSSDGTFVDTIYRYIKFNKTKGRYVFWASPDGISWIEVGNTSFYDSGTIGFFINSTGNQELIDNSHCFFNEFALYNSKYLIFDGIDKGYEAEIYDENGNILLRTDNTGFANIVSRMDKRMIVNTNTLPMPIKRATLRIFSPDSYTHTIEEYLLGEDTYGGDGFTIERDIRIFRDNQELDPLEMYDLGTFYRGSYYVKLDIFNNEEYTVHDVKMKVIRYSEYYNGEAEVGLALYDENQSEDKLVYEKELIIDEIHPSEGRSVFIKLIDKPIQDFYMTANSYRFKIIIE